MGQKDTSQIDTTYYTDFNEFSLNGRVSNQSNGTVKVITEGDSMTVYFTNVDSVKFFQKGDTYYREVSYHMENWNRMPCKCDWHYPRIYHCYTRNDTIIELMQEYCAKELEYSEIYLKTKGNTTISVTRTQTPIQDSCFDQLLQFMAAYRHKDKLSNQQIVNKKNTEGHYSLFYSLTQDHHAIYYNKDFPTDTLFVRKLKYPNYWGLNCGVFEDGNVPTASASKYSQETSITKYVQTYVEARLNIDKQYLKDIPRDKRSADVVIFISEEGNVYDVKIAKSIHPIVDSEIIRICKKLPKFEPNMVDGKKIKWMLGFQVNLPSAEK